MKVEKLAFEPLNSQEEFQLHALNELKQYLLMHSKFYQQQWALNDCVKSTISCLKDLENFPITTKQDIQVYDQDFYCIAAQDIREFNTTSGTLGQPITIPLSESDLNRLAYNEQLSFEKLNIQKGERVQLMLTLDRLFMAGMSYYGGLKNIGATVIRTGAGVPQLQWDAIQQYQPTTLVAVPSFLIKLLQFAEARGIDYKNSSVKKVLAIGESLKDKDLKGNTLYHTIKDKWDIELYNTYASTEMQTGFTECACGHGAHQHTDLLVVEILDENGKQVPAGVVGEVCITTLGVTAMPLWRYKTGDMACLYNEPCACGRNSPRLSGIVGRKNQMLKVKGTTLYPSAIFEALHQYTDINDYVVEVKHNSLGQDEVHIHLCLHTEVDQQHTLSLVDYLRGKLKIVPELHIVSEVALKSMQFPEMSRKQIKFVDCRNTN